MAFKKIMSREMSDLNIFEYASDLVASYFYYHSFMRLKGTNYYLHNYRTWFHVVPIKGLTDGVLGYGHYYEYQGYHWCSPMHIKKIVPFEKVLNCAPEDIKAVLLFNLDLF